MKIGIDARFYGSIGKGLGRYTQKLIENLEKTDNANTYFIFLKKENFDEYQPQNSNFHKILADYKWYSFEEQFCFPKLLKKYSLDLMHFPHFNVPFFYRKPFIVTIHDLILLHFPTVKNTTRNRIFYWIKFLVYKLVIKSALNRAKKIIAVSNFTKNDILENYKNMLAEKIEVTYEACDDFCLFNSQKSENILKKYGIIKPYMLYVGNAYPHKNLDKLVLAFKETEKEFTDLKLVFVGKEDYFYKRIKKQVADEKCRNIVFSGYVPDEELEILYRNALFYVWPSLYEGFGLPPLEAMAKGIPVISSSSACMKEILGESALFFNAERVEDIQEAVKKIMQNENLRKDLREKGFAQVARYSWKKMAKETIEIYTNSL